MSDTIKNTTTTISENDENKNLLLAKVVAMLVLGLCSFLIGLLPLKLTKMISLKGGDKNLCISLLLCFGGGVLLFTTFIHLQPEVREGFQHLEHRGILPEVGKGVPLSELVFCVGFFFVYLIEELVHLILDRKAGNDDALRRSLSIRCSARKASNVAIPRVTLAKFDDGTISCISTSNKELLEAGKIEDKHQHEHSHAHLDDKLKNSFGGFLAVLALSFHAVFEGLAVGLEGAVQKVWYLFAAIACHKFVIGFCVGIELVTSKTKLYLLVLYIGTFALVTPLGIGIGIGLSEGAAGGSGGDAVSVVLQGMAAGTLLYVVFFEVLARERGNAHSGTAQLIAIIAGFAVMFTLQILTGVDHNHTGEGGHSHHHSREPAAAHTEQHEHTHLF